MNNEDKLRQYLKRVTLDLQATRKRLQEVESGPGEPVAIVAMSCRYPGAANSPEQLWELVSGGVDAIGAPPSYRGWDRGALSGGAADESFVDPVGGFVETASDFDAELFGISPREALAMDPQQRLLLESSWELFERAGIDPLSLRGSRTGVFIGGTSQDHAVKAALGGSDYGLAGTASSVLSGRLSYVFGLEGPAVTIDTACSSSLVALHLAVRSVRSGECGLAVAGGATVMSTPGAFVEFSRQGGLSQSGRCKSFATGADGTGWGEGVGLVLVERLSEAQRLGHRVLAVVRGSAVNQDGASNGLTAPNGPSQRRVIQAALADARLLPADVDAVEAHGTGTVLGDPIEAQALLATYGQDREQPLWLGSIKSNIGHTQSAAGVAGVLKVILAMQHGVLPKTLHVDEPTTQVDWSAGAVRLLTDTVPWPSSGDRPRRAGVSSFGASGTNSHIVLEQAPEAPPHDDAATRVGDGKPGVLPVVLSARSAEALRAQADRLRTFIDDRPDIRHPDLAHALATTRAALPHRAVVISTDSADLDAGLAAVADGANAATVVCGAARAGKVVFAFPGQGAQWVGMGRELLATDGVFAARMRECAAEMDPLTGWSLLDVVAGDQGSLDRVDVVQPVSFAVMVSLAAVWESCGVTPDVVVGHSQGEIAAACVAGALSLADAAKVVVRRSQVIAAELSGRGGMASVSLAAEQVREAVERFGDRVSVAAVNGPQSTVVSGETAALDELVAGWVASGLRARRIDVDYASHSVQVDAVAAELVEALGDVDPQRGRVSMFSTVRGKVLDGSELDAAYWVENLRAPVLFDEAVQALLGQGYRFVIEVSSHPVLVPAVEQGIDRSGASALVLGTLRRDDGGRDRLLAALAQAWVHGVVVGWSVACGEPSGQRVELPTYAFQRQRYWLDWGAPTVPAADPVDAKFWELVESGDIRSLADLVDADPATGSDGIVAALGDWRRRVRRKADANAWRHVDAWRRFSVSPAPLPDRWLIVRPAGDDAEGVLAAVLAGLTPPNCILVQVDPEADRAALTEQIRAALDATGNVTGVLSLLAFTGLADALRPDVPAAVSGNLALVQAMADLAIDAPQWWLTRGAVRAGNDDPPPIPAHTQLWALGRVVALEHPRGWGGLIDLPQTIDEAAIGQVAGLLTAVHGEDQIAVRDGAALGRRLVPDAIDGGAWQPRGTVLITGGTGALGGHVARWAANHGAEHVLLVSRSGDQAESAPVLTAELEALGARVSFAACDVTDQAELVAVLGRIPAEQPLTAVVHTAGIAFGGLVSDTTTEQLALANAAKVAGAAHLDVLTRDLELDAFVLFSSGSASWGSAGNAVYAMGNAYLDGLVLRRKASGLPATSIAWGVWGGGGMVEGAAEKSLGRRGLRPMDPEVAVHALAAAVGHEDTLVTVADVDWGRFAETFTIARPSRLIGELPGVEGAGSGSSSTGDRELLIRLRELPASEQARFLADLVRGQVAYVLGHAGPQAIEPTRPFAELGFDSLTAVELRNRLKTTTGLALPSTLVFDYPTVVAVGEFLRDELIGALESTPAALVSAVADDGDPVVIVAMSCRYPGGVESPEDLWSLVADGVDAITEFPDDRGWDLSIYDPDSAAAGTTYVREGGFVSTATEFDAELFGISPREALAMDPQQRLLLESSWELFERAGIDPLSLRGSRTGVFIGGSSQDHALKALFGGSATDGYVLTGTAGSVLSGRISYVYGLEGPAVTIDTGCSSSLVALDWAVRSVRNGECETAIAGGVEVMSTTGAFVEFSRQGGLSRSARCKSFAAGADGTGWGEGVGLVLVERLSQAQRLGHQVLAVVRGSSVNQDGASNGLTAPNGPSQQRVIRQALASAGLTTADVDAVEAHGTGTALGDPIEAQALLATYGRDRPADRPLWLGSIKSNIGHTQAAAGVAGVIKMVAAMQHGVLPKTLHADELTPEVDWSSGAVQVLTEAQSWPNVARPRRAAVSAFGVSGTNAHLILEAVADHTESAVAPSDEVTTPVWVLSSRTEVGLRAQAARLRDYVAAEHDSTLTDIGYALTTRAALARRTAIVAPDRAGYLDGLDAIAAGNSARRL
ncbi:acyl transferase domain protein [Rhodococcus sp. MTM3W5.2]|nr:acyl transferase domain protein [Rhodococcus sp. MTM3W5.2]